MLAYALKPARLPQTISAARAAESKKAVTFTKDVASILFNNCTSCHRPGEVAPFPLMNYADAKKRAKQLAMVTESKFMPPWKADPNFGEYHDARVLTKEQIETLKAWADNGAPEG